MIRSGYLGSLAPVRVGAGMVSVRSEGFSERSAGFWEGSEESPPPGGCSAGGSGMGFHGLASLKLLRTTWDAPVRLGVFQ